MRNHLSKTATIVLKKQDGVKCNTRYFLYFDHSNTILYINVHHLNNTKIQSVKYENLQFRKTLLIKALILVLLIHISIKT
jgi:hypothetical protein